MCCTLLFAACKKETNVTFIESPTSGDLTYKVLDGSGAGMVGVKVDLYRPEVGTGNYSKYEKHLAASALTNANGLATFSGLPAETYLVAADSVSIDQENYQMQDYMQVVAGKMKEKERKATDFSGQIVVSIRSQYDSKVALRNVGVVLVRDHAYNMNYQQLVAEVNKTKLKGTTDENGQFTFRVPVRTPYYLILYTPGSFSTVVYAAGFLSVERDQIYNFTIYTSPIIMN